MPRASSRTVRTRSRAVERREQRLLPLGVLVDDDEVRRTDFTAVRPSLRVEQRGDPPPLALSERAFAQRVRELLEVRDAVDEHRLLIGIR